VRATCVHIRLRARTAPAERPDPADRPVLAARSAAHTPLVRPFGLAGGTAAVDALCQSAGPVTHGQLAIGTACIFGRSGIASPVPPHFQAVGVVRSAVQPFTGPDHRRVGETGNMLLIDAANVVGSRPTGWWRDRPGAARAFVERVRAAAEADRFTEPVVVVLEGAARRGVAEGTDKGVRVLHAPGSGDDMLVAVATGATTQVTIVTADRALRQRAEAVGARAAGPGWLLDLLDR
jgi:hypothetical protein